MQGLPAHCSRAFPRAPNNMRGAGELLGSNDIEMSGQHLCFVVSDVFFSYSSLFYYLGR